MNETARAIEALLFLSPDPLAVETLARLADVSEEEAATAVEFLTERHEDGGIELAEVGGGYTLRTQGDLEDVCDRLRNRPPEDRLSPAALETLAIVAYLEPVSRPDMGRLRGVAVDSTVANLVDRGLLEESGRADGSGAVLYRTTRAFQKRFGLANQRDLPPLDRFELTGPQAEELRQRLIQAGHLDPNITAESSEAAAEPGETDAADGALVEKHVSTEVVGDDAADDETTADEASSEAPDSGENEQDADAESDATDDEESGDDPVEDEPVGP